MNHIFKEQKVLLLEPEILEAQDLIIYIDDVKNGGTFSVLPYEGMRGGHTVNMVCQVDRHTWIYGYGVSDQDLGKRLEARLDRSLFVVGTIISAFYSVVNEFSETEFSLRRRYQVK